jgi:hypothetical protein
MNADVISEAPQDRWAATHQVRGFYSLQHDDQWCLLTQKLDSIFFDNLRKKSETTMFKLNHARKATDTASNAPAGFKLALQAFELSEIVKKLCIATNHAVTLAVGWTCKMNKRARTG